MNIEFSRVTTQIIIENWVSFGIKVYTVTQFLTNLTLIYMISDVTKLSTIIRYWLRFTSNSLKI